MSADVRAAIVGLGSYVPQKVLTNQDLERMVDTSDEWITQRTGIKERRVVSEADSTASMGTEAGRRACAAAGVDPADLDLIICATITPETLCPGSACYIQRDLGAAPAAAFDLAAACSGFLYGLAVAARFIESGQFKNCLVVGSETLTRFTDWTDRSSCILFGDGAGAAVLQPTRDPNRGFQYCVMHADGSGWDYIWIPAGGARMPASTETIERRMHFLKMRGRDVYKFAIEKMQWLLADCMAACDLTPDAVDLVVPHQVNIRIIKSATRKLNFPLEKVYVNIDKRGNTSAASIPIALDEAARAGRIGPGSTVLLIAFGAGLTWSGAVVRL
ncbi:MAG: 3-oxoacyl-ACP synthase [Planctomycetales bacterium 4484_123]|nr:MAG: 3-oxoacyl-ACP synthase [Planctomycetales bacterium 4484_123]